MINHPSSSQNSKSRFLWLNPRTVLILFDLEFLEFQFFLFTLLNSPYFWFLTFHFCPAPGSVQVLPPKLGHSASSPLDDPPKKRPETPALAKTKGRTMGFGVQRGKAT